MQPGDALAMADALRERMRHGESPDGVDRVANALRQIATREGSGARAAEALRSAAALYATRYLLGRDDDDLARADAYNDELVAIGGTAGCAALEASAGLHEHAGDVATARERYLRYERECRDAPDLGHVRATLALLDPSTARAESQASTDRAAHGRVERFERFNPDRPRAIRSIVIDPGHGGWDPGARSESGLAESEVTLDIARRLADELSRSLGVQVLLTRDADVYVPLESRAQRANDAGADLFVSIHCNSSGNPESRGVSTYVLDTTDDRVAARVAARENGAVASEPAASPEVFRILADLRLLGQGSRSLEVAAAIQSGLVQTLRRAYGDVPDLGTHTARFHVLVGTRMPAVLVELSFLSNPVEAQRLGDPAYRAVLASALRGGIARYAQGFAVAPAVVHRAEPPRP